MSARYVQSCITAISFPGTIEELESRIASNRYVYGALTDIDTLGYFDRSHDTWWTAPRWMTKGDILFFYHTKSARINAERLERQLALQPRAKPRHCRAVERGILQAKAFSETIFACAEVGGRSTRIGSLGDSRHFRSTVFAPLSRVHVFRSPLPNTEFSRVLTLSPGGTLTPVHGRALTSLKGLLGRRNVLPAFLRNARPGSLGFRGVSAKTWPKVVSAPGTAFIDESQIRAYLIDYLLKDVKDQGTKVLEECRCTWKGLETGRADYFVRVHGQWIPVEAKLNVGAEGDLVGQMRRYLKIDGIYPGRGTTSAELLPLSPPRIGLIVDSDGVYVLSRGRYIGGGPGYPLWSRRKMSHRTGGRIREKVAQLMRS